MDSYLLLNLLLFSPVFGGITKWIMTSSHGRNRRQRHSLILLMIRFVTPSLDSTPIVSFNVTKLSMLSILASIDYNIRASFDFYNYEKFSGTCCGLLHMTFILCIIVHDRHEYLVSVLLVDCHHKFVHMERNVFSEYHVYGNLVSKPDTPTTATSG